MPIDNKRVEAYSKSALKYYEEENQTDQIAIIVENNEGQGSTVLCGRCFFQCPDKQKFTLINPEEPKEIGRGVGFEAVSGLIKAEISHVVKTILTQKETNVTQVKELDFSKVTETVEKISRAGYTATVLIAPWKKISSAWQLDPQFRTHITYGGHNERYLMLDESTKLRIIELDGNHAFILDKSVGIWTTVKPMEVEIKASPKTPSLVQITACELIDYRILTPEAVEILEFILPAKQESKFRNWFFNFFKKRGR